MTLTVQTMRNAAALNVDIRVHLHFKGIYYIDAWVPNQFFLYTVFNGKVTEFGP